MADKCLDDICLHISTSLCTLLILRSDSPQQPVSALDVNCLLSGVGLSSPVWTSYSARPKGMRTNFYSGSTLPRGTAR